MTYFKNIFLLHLQRVQHYCNLLLDRFCFNCVTIDKLNILYLFAVDADLNLMTCFVAFRLSIELNFELNIWVREYNVKMDIFISMQTRKRAEAYR